MLPLWCRLLVMSSRPVDFWLSFSPLPLLSVGGPSRQHSGPHLKASPCSPFLLRQSCPATQCVAWVFPELLPQHRECLQIILLFKGCWVVVFEIWLLLYWLECWDWDHCSITFQHTPQRWGTVLELPRLFSKKSWFPDTKESMAAEAGEMLVQRTRVWLTTRIGRLCTTICNWGFGGIQCPLLASVGSYTRLLIKTSCFWKWAVYLFMYLQLQSTFYICGVLCYILIYVYIVEKSK